MTVAALYVATRGVYYGLHAVDPWDHERDARKYAGPHPVVAHPPCARWGAYWFGGPGWIGRGNPPKKKGDDGGCFKAALDAVRRHGGVLEHPARSHAWAAFDLAKPPLAGWIPADFFGGWTCQVEQGNYGHRARKPTWLYVNARRDDDEDWSHLPDMRWGKSDANAAWAAEGRSEKSMTRMLKDGICVLLSHKERAATPIPFRDLLLSIARECRQ